MLTIESVTNARWCDPNKTQIQCNLKLHQFNETFTNYNANIVDTEPHVVELFRRATAGEIAVHPEPLHTQEEWDGLMRMEDFPAQPTSNGAQPL